jgi:hypothetical protein
VPRLDDLAAVGVFQRLVLKPRRLQAEFFPSAQKELLVRGNEVSHGLTPKYVSM